MNLPEEIENKILSELELADLYTKSAFYQNQIDKLRKELFNLSQIFVSECKVIKEYSDAYFCYNFPQNFMKSMILAKKNFEFYRIPVPGEVKILDLGCGDGAGIFGLYYFLHKQNAQTKFSLTGVDLNVTFLKRAKAMAERFKRENSNIEFQLIRESAQKFIQKNNADYDFIILSSSLTEIFQSEKIPLSFIISLLRSLKNKGLLIIIEPALKNLTRRLMKLHDDLIINRIGEILLPCLHNNECPELKKEEEWCHQSIKWNPPDYLKFINQRLFRKIEFLKFSYLIISNHGYNLPNSNLYAVISRLFREKGRIRLFICTENGVVELIRLNRDKTIINESFDRISMGDIINIIDPIKIKPKIWKVNKETRVKRLDF